MTTPLPTLAELARKAKESGQQTDSWKFAGACTPETILAVAAEVEGLRADAEKFRALTRCMDSITVEFSGLSMMIKPAPKAHILLSALVQGAINATDGIDTARTDRSST